MLQLLSFFKKNLFPSLPPNFPLKRYIIEVIKSEVIPFSSEARYLDSRKKETDIVLTLVEKLALFMIAIFL